MYERNAIVIERYFNVKFGYNMKHNIKTNFADYCALVESFDKYKNITDEEESIIQEYDIAANNIREKQNVHDNLISKKNHFQDEINNIIQNIDEDVEKMKKQIDTVTNKISDVDNDIKENAIEFSAAVVEFNEKSDIRINCGRERKKIEGEYNRKLNMILDNYQLIDQKLAKQAKEFVENDKSDTENELNIKIRTNGEKEKIKFASNVITKAIELSIDVQKKEAEIYCGIYEKTSKLFTEIKNNSVKIEKHKKNIKDSNAKLEFISAIKEYLIQFLDNERLAAMNGIDEHERLMQEACSNLENDLIQIGNLYTLVIKETSKKASKKAYTELYNIDYLNELEDKSEDFEQQIKKLNLPVTILNPNYWRVEGMHKIYDVFNDCVAKYYDRDIYEYIPRNEEINQTEDYEEEIILEEPKKEIVNVENIPEEPKKQEKSKKIEPITDVKSEIDRKIDLILGIDSNSSHNEDDWNEDDWNDEEWDENWVDEEKEKKEHEQIREKRKQKQEEKEDDDYEDIDYIFGNNDEDNSKIWDVYDKEEEKIDDNFVEADEEDYDDLDSIYDDDLDDEDDYEDIDEDDYYEEDDDQQDEENSPRSKYEEAIYDYEDSDETSKEDWENEFINIKRRKKKKKSFFDKFKK